MNRTLTLIVIALTAGMGYDSAVTLVEQMTATLPADDIEAGRMVATAANAITFPS